MSQLHTSDPMVVMQSMWMNDVERRLSERVAMLLNKTYRNLRWTWLVGDCEDNTADWLRYHLATCWSDKADRVTLIEMQTRVIGHSQVQRLRRMCVTANIGLDSVRPTDDYLLIHESDLETPVDLIELLLATGKCPIAGWVTMQVNPIENVFYDIWGYRQNGKCFTDVHPYCDNYNPTQPFEVDSVGSVWMMHAEDFVGPDGVRIETEACVEMCEKLRERGRTIWVDPTLPIVQPKDLWEPQSL